MDIISNLPLSITETILCFLPIKEAARTSILSKEWRYHWIRIPKLVFIEDPFQLSANDDKWFLSPQTRLEQMIKRCKLCYAIFQVLLIHEGPIIDFTLSLDTAKSCAEIDYMLNHLSRKNSNTVKKLTLHMLYGYKTPVSLFSFSKLTDLYLNCCEFGYQPTFNGFRSLTSLYMENITTTKKMLLHILSSSPLLKTVTLRINGSTIELNDDSTLYNLFECLPVIEKLTVSFNIVECFVEDRVPKVLATALVHLKYLCLEGIPFIHRYGLPFIFLLIKSSPNLQKLKLELYGDAWLDLFEIPSFTFEDYSDIWLEQLNELEIIKFGNREYELDFVKLILANSPALKRLKIYFEDDVDDDDELKITRILSRFPHASPLVKNDVGETYFIESLFC